MGSVQKWQTAHRAYEIDQHTFIKRELRQSELLQDLRGRNIPLPENSKARLQNEFLVLQYLHHNTDIPVPKPIKFFEENGVAILMTSCVPEDAVALSDYAGEDRESVIDEIEQQLVTKIIPALRQHTSHHIGGLNDGEELLLPPRVTNGCERNWTRSAFEEHAFELCHNDLSQDNLFIDPNSHEVLAIVDWEYAGYYYPVFEARLWRYHPRDQDWDAHNPQAVWHLLEALSATKHEHD